MKPDTTYHTCCGNRKRYRAIDGELVEQPHECSTADDVLGKDWAAIKDAQIVRKESV